MKKRRWVIHKPLSEKEKTKFPDIHPVILQLLFNRGITSRRQMENFLSARFESISSPFDLTDMDKAVARVLKALKEGEKITVYADYDADAVTACAVLYLGLERMGAQKLAYYIPDRFEEGYGVNLQAVEQIAKQGTNLMITVDCGINSIREVERAKELGMDVIVTDHHHITDGLPPACAVVNHHREKREELAGLTGVGTAFKLMQGLMAALFPEEYAKVYHWNVPKTARENFQPGEKLPNNVLFPHWEKWLLDLVAIGTVADCQQLTGESRILVKYGLRVLKKTRWMGLKQLLRSAGIEDSKNFDTFKIGFIIAPRINAAGRIQHADIALRLLISQTAEEAALYAGQLESLNAHRQRLTKQVFSEALSQIELQQENKLLVVMGENWPKGVVGLVASRIAEEYYRPVVVLEKSNGSVTGSARSIPSFDIVDAFSAAAELLERFGGHSQAAGLTIRTHNVEKFHQKILEFAEAKITDEDLAKTQYIDLVAEPEEINQQLIDQLKDLEPYGSGNPVPTFLFEKMRVENMRLVGNNSTHLKLQARKNSQIFDMIGFGQGFRAKSLAPGDLFDVIVHPSENEWNGKKEVQFKIIDLKKSN